MVKKVHYGLTFGAWTIASVLYTGARNTIRGNTAILFSHDESQIVTDLLLQQFYENVGGVVERSPSL